jgi:DnaJ-class molecular chaperone
MRPSGQQKKEAPARNGDPGDLWHAMARLHAAHPEPVGLSVPFERPAARLSIVKPEDIVLSARVELFELMIGVREELPLHTGHVADAIGTIGARSAPGGGQCFHCEGTGRARTLWERSLSDGHDVA